MTPAQLTGSAASPEGADLGHEELQEVAMTIEASPEYDALRERAIKRLKKRQDFHGHLLIYALVNSFFVVIWAVVNHHVFFWPVFPMVGWGIGVVMNAWDVYRDDELDEARIREEIERLKS